ncbi:MAG: C25 family peptidase propeptide domain-containing protein [bacterium]
MSYDTVEYLGTMAITELGKPQLTMTSVYVSLPFGSTVNSVSIVDSDTEDISGNFLIYPAQPPKPISEYTTEAKFTLPDPSVYNFDQFYPQNPYSEPFISSFNGADMGGIIVYPFRYNPVERHLELFTSLTLRLNYTPPSPPPSAVRYMENRNKDMIIENVKL